MDPRDKKTIQDQEDNHDPLAHLSPEERKAEKPPERKTDTKQALDLWQKLPQDMRLKVLTESLTFSDIIQLGHVSATLRKTLEEDIDTLDPTVEAHTRPLTYLYMIKGLALLQAHIKSGKSPLLDDQWQALLSQKNGLLALGKQLFTPQEIGQLNDVKVWQVLLTDDGLTFLEQESFAKILAEYRDNPKQYSQRLIIRHGTQQQLDELFDDSFDMSFILSNLNDILVRVIAPNRLAVSSRSYRSLADIPYVDDHFNRDLDLIDRIYNLCAPFLNVASDNEEELPVPIKRLLIHPAYFAYAIQDPTFIPYLRTFPLDEIELILEGFMIRFVSDLVYRQVVTPQQLNESADLQRGLSYPSFHYCLLHGLIKYPQCFLPENAQMLNFIQHSQLLHQYAQHSELDKVRQLLQWVKYPQMQALRNVYGKAPSELIDILAKANKLNALTEEQTESLFNPPAGIAFDLDSDNKESRRLSHVYFKAVIQAPHTLKHLDYFKQHPDAWYIICEEKLTLEEYFALNEAGRAKVEESFWYGLLYFDKLSVSEMMSVSPDQEKLIRHLLRDRSPYNEPLNFREILTMTLTPENFASLLKIPDLSMWIYDGFTLQEIVNMEKDDPERFALVFHSCIANHVRYLNLSAEHCRSLPIKTLEVYAENRSLPAMSAGQHALFSGEESSSSANPTPPASSSSSSSSPDAGKVPRKKS